MEAMHTAKRHQPPASLRICNETLCMVIGFLDQAAWLRCRRVCHRWQIACDQVGLGSFWVRLSSSCKARGLKSFAEKYAFSVTKLDLTSVVASTALDVLLKHLVALEEIKLLKVSGRWTEALLQRPSLRGLTILDTGSTPLKVQERKNLASLFLWQAYGVKDKDVRLLIGDKLENLCISDSQYVGDSTLRTISRNAPPLGELVMRQVSSLSPNSLKSMLMTCSSTLHTLDLTGSCPGMALFPDVQLPKLESFISDSNAMDVSPALINCPNLQLLSVVRCSKLGDGLFAACILSENRPTSLRELVVVRLSGTKVSNFTLEFLETLPKLKVIQAESCRNLSRSVRLRLAERNRKFGTVESLAPALRFASIAQHFLNSEEDSLAF